MRFCAFKRLLASACALALVAMQPSCASAHLCANATKATTRLLHDKVTFGATHGCGLGRVVSPPASAWADRRCPYPTLAAAAVAQGAAIPTCAPALSGVRQRLAAEAGAAQTSLKQAADRTRDMAEQAPVAGAAWVLARHAQASHGYASAAVADAAAAALKRTREPLQRGLAIAATAVNRAHVLLAAKTQQLAGAAVAAFNRMRAAAADAAALLHGRCQHVTDATAAMHKHTRASLQRGLPAAAAAVNSARALIAPKMRQLGGAAATALGRAWPDPKVYPLHATAELLVGAAATAGGAAAWAWPAAQAAAAQCRERALLAALRGRRQAMHAAGGLPPPAGLLCSGMARCVLLHAVCSCC